MARRRRVTTLRALTKDDAAALARWLPGVASDMACEAWPDEDALQAAIGGDGVLAVVEGDCAGLLAYDVRAPKRNAARVRFLAIDPTQRRLGIGGRAALALEERLAGSFARVYVTVPARLGLALYFWLRLGYRPLTKDAWPAEPEDVPSVWMVRELR
ncbi:MAG: GNAT family N-acetyltransferase [Dehalococcoidia bacterium]